PSGLVERFPGLVVDSIHTLREGSGVKLSAATIRPALLQIARAKSFLFLGNADERWVKLHKRGVHRAVLQMAGVARGLGRNLFGRRSPVLEPEERPFAGKARLVLDMHLHSRAVGGLKMTRLVNGSIASRAAHFQHQQRLVRP